MGETAAIRTGSVYDAPVATARSRGASAPASSHTAGQGSVSSPERRSAPVVSCTSTALRVPAGPIASQRRSAGGWTSAASGDQDGATPGAAATSTSSDSSAPAAAVPVVVCSVSSSASPVVSRRPEASTAPTGCTGTSASVANRRPLVSRLSAKTVPAGSGLAAPGVVTLSTVTAA